MCRTLRLPAGLFRLRWLVLVTRAPLRRARGRGLGMHELWALSTATWTWARGTHTGSGTLELDGATFSGETVAIAAALSFLGGAQQRGRIAVATELARRTPSTGSSWPLQAIASTC